MNIKKLFLDLTEYTIPSGKESKMEKFFPGGIQEDGCGNYFIKIGNSRTIFTSHMDSACGDYKKVNHVIDGPFIKTDGKSILSADDKSGMAIMLYMIDKKVPGTYYFFHSEERGMVGARQIIAKNVEFFKDYDRMISFDRRAYHSIITVQLGKECCSKEFALALADELNRFEFNYMPNPTGIFTDSASFIGIIPECTNLSVGYFHEHSWGEKQDIVFLEALAKAVCLVNWENLPIGEIKNEPYRYYDGD